VANAFGERQRPDGVHGAVAVFLNKALNDEEITVWGDGSIIRDYVYALDVASAFVLAAEYDKPESIFNIGSGRGCSVNELLSAIEELLGRPVPRCYLAGRRFDVPMNVLDTSRATGSLGWTPQFTFTEGLKRTLEHLQSGVVST
jgi:UDP-glucose 4-epimerase